VESIAGDIFQLGNTSYRILRIEAGKVRVEDAQGQPPTIPFWLGEAPGRSAELSFAVARLQAHIDELLSASPGNLQPAIDWLIDNPWPEFWPAPNNWSIIWPVRARPSALCPRRTRW
jgi:ATP-dependent Lhr-like helicase